jgi:hypothetical protein
MKSIFFLLLMISSLSWGLTFKSDGSVVDKQGNLLSQKVLGIKSSGHLLQIPADYSAPRSSLEYVNTIYAERPALQGDLFQNYTQGAMVIADFNQDGTQELFSAHDPKEYVDFTFGPNRGKLMISPSIGKKKIKRSRLVFTFSFLRS